mgnify:CR=1 FL=1
MGIGKRGLFLISAVAVIAISIFTTLYLGFRGSITQEFASLVIGGIGAFATATLAIATYTTVLQNRRTVEELQKDREKPLAEDKLRELVVPFIGELGSRIEDMQQGDAAWVQFRNSYGNPTGEIPYGNLLTDDINETVIRELESDNPDLLEKILEHDRQSAQLEQEVEDALDIIEEDVEEFVDENSLYDDEGDPVDCELVSKLVLTKYDGHSGPRHYDEFWDSNRDDLIEYVQPGEIGGYIDQRREYLEYCIGLRDELVDYKVELQQKYGISETDIQDLNISDIF